MNIFLTPEEVAELTGYTMPSKQAEWLLGRAWVFELSGFGKVKVLRRYAEMKLGIPASDTVTKPIEPDFSSLQI